MLCPLALRLLWIDTHQRRPVHAADVAAAAVVPAAAGAAQAREARAGAAALAPSSARRARHREGNGPTPQDDERCESREQLGNLDGECEVGERRERRRVGEEGLSEHDVRARERAQREDARRERHLDHLLVGKGSEGGLDVCNVADLARDERACARAGRRQRGLGRDARAGLRRMEGRGAGQGGLVRVSARLRRWRRRQVAMRSSRRIASSSIERRRRASPTRPTHRLRPRRRLRLRHRLGPRRRRRRRRHRRRRCARGGAARECRRRRAR